MFVKIVKTLNGIMERMTPRQLLIAAGVAGVLVCLLIYFTISSFEEKIIAEQPEPVEMQEVVVATGEILRGTVIKTEMLQMKAFAKKSLPAGYASDVRIFEGLPARVDIMQGDILTEEKVYSDIRQAGFKGMIPPDCRAVTIPIDNVTGVAGLLSPGDFVDVMLVSSDSGLQGGGTKSEVLLQNVLLLSIDKNMNRLSGDLYVETEEPKEKGINEDLTEVQQSAEELADTANTMHRQAKDTFAGKGFNAAKQGKSMSGLGAAGSGDGGGDNEGTATLALKPQDVLKIAAATQSGTIYLALRPFKPAPTSMFIAETEYYTSPPTTSAPARTTTPAPAPVTRPVASPTFNPPTPAFQPPRANVPTVTRPPDSPYVNQPAPKEDKPSYEVIKWGK